MQGGEISVTRGEVFSWILCTMINICKNNKAWIWRCSTEQWCRPRKQWKDWTADYEGSLDLRKEKRLCSQIQYFTHWPGSRSWWAFSLHPSPQKGGFVRKKQTKVPFQKMSQSPKHLKFPLPVLSGWPVAPLGPGWIIEAEKSMSWGLRPGQPPPPPSLTHLPISSTGFSHGKLPWEKFWSSFILWWK